MPSSYTGVFDLHSRISSDIIRCSLKRELPEWASESRKCSLGKPWHHSIDISFPLQHQQESIGVLVDMVLSRIGGTPI